jgi:hypothetical protein
MKLVSVNKPLNAETFLISSSKLNLHRVVKSRRLRWAGHIARMKGDRNAFKISRGKFM